MSDTVLPRQTLITVTKPIASTPVATVSPPSRPTMTVAPALNPIPPPTSPSPLPPPNAPPTSTPPLPPTTATTTTTTTTTSSTPKKKCKRTWDSDDEELLLEQIDEKGKAKWEYVLKAFHSKHRLTDMPLDDADKLRTKYNDLSNKNKSKLFKPYIIPAFVSPKKKLAEAEMRKKEQEHTSEHVAIQQRLERMRELVEKIEKRESCLDSSSKGSDADKEEAELRKRMREQGEERKKVRNERLEASEQMAMKEQQFREILAKSTAELTKVITTATLNSDKISNLFEKYLMIMIAKQSPDFFPINTPMTTPSTTRISTPSSSDDEQEEPAEKRRRK